MKGIPRATVSGPRKDGQRTTVSFVRFSRVSKSFSQTVERAGTPRTPTGISRFYLRRGDIVRVWWNTFLYYSNRFLSLLDRLRGSTAGVTGFFDRARLSLINLMVARK